MQRKPRLINNLRESIPTIFCYSTICHITIFFASLHHGSVVQWIEFKIPVLTIAVRIRSESLRKLLVLRVAFLPLARLWDALDDGFKPFESARNHFASYSFYEWLFYLLRDFGTPSMMALSHSNPLGSAILYVMQLHAHHSNSKYNK